MSVNCYILFYILNFFTCSLITVCYLLYERYHFYYYLLTTVCCDAIARAIALRTAVFLFAASNTSANNVISIRVLFRTKCNEFSLCSKFLSCSNTCTSVRVSSANRFKDEVRYSLTHVHSYLCTYCTFF